MIPNNGSPGPNKFSPQYNLVFAKTPNTFVDSTVNRLPNDIDSIIAMKRKVKNPRFDADEGVHSLIG